jgi:hypothetical protein
MRTVLDPNKPAAALKGRNQDIRTFIRPPAELRRPERGFGKPGISSEPALGLPAMTSGGSDMESLSSAQSKRG